MDSPSQVASPYANRRLPHVYDTSAFNAFATVLDDDDHRELLAARSFARSIPALENHPRFNSVVSATDVDDEDEYVFITGNLRARVVE